MTRFSRIARSALSRLIAGYVLVAVVFAAAWTWSLYGPLTASVLEQRVESLTAVAQSAALLVTESGETPSRIAKQLVARTDLRLTIVAADGTVMADSDTDPTTMENHADRPEVATALGGTVGTDRRVSQSEGIEQLYVAVPATHDGARVAVRVAQPLTQIRAIAAGTRRVGLTLLVAALVIATVAAYPVLKAAARPIADLSRSAQTMAAGDLTTPIPRVPDDLAPLAESLGSLRAQIRSRLEALEAERARLESTLNGLEDAILVMDGEVIDFANDAADLLFGRPPTGWQGQRLAASTLPAALAAAVRRSTAQQVTTAEDLDPDPLGRVFRLWVSPGSSGAPYARRIVVISDVTERARLDRLRRDFVANASHELKTPAAGIGLLADSAALAAQDGETTQALEFARQIASEASRLQHLVRDLLDLARLENAPNPEAITDMRVIIDRVVVSHRSGATAKGLALIVDLQAVSDIDVFAAADPTDVTIAADNLVDNAIAYTAAGTITITLAVDGDTVTLAVTDTGAGIEPEHLSRIFERFYRVDRGRSREAGGTGLGLALTRHAAERNGGSITVESTPGAGATFTLRLRRAS